MNDQEGGDINTVHISRSNLVSLGANRLARLLLDMASSDRSVLETLRVSLGEHTGEPADVGEIDLGEGEPYMVGSSPAMQEVYTTIRKFAAVDAPVLITGDSGTGKELAARAIHERSARAKGPFAIINCAALPPTLIASELFGHEKGSFTGAHRRKIGRIETANGGTVFLDEIGDLPLDMQVHLLRFLQEKTIDRVGGTTPITVDARVIAATNADVAKAMEEGRFREDLFYRLNVLTLEMAPLRERGDDIDLLGMFFLRKFAEDLGRPIRGIQDDARAAIQDYHWPGNVRELVACVRRAVVMADGEWVTLGDLGLPNAGPTGPKRPTINAVSLEEARNQAENDIIRKTLRLHHRNIKKAAGELKISRPTLYRLIEKHRIQTYKEMEPESTR